MWDGLSVVGTVSGICRLSSSTKHSHYCARPDKQVLEPGEWLFGSQRASTNERAPRLEAEATIPMFRPPNGVGAGHLGDR